MSVELDDRLELHPQVALRPEPFGALAYHYDTRRLVFLRSPEIVTVVRAVGDASDVGEALSAAGVEAARWPAFLRALGSLADSGIVRPRFPPGQVGPEAGGVGAGAVTAVGRG